jgi:hypothetical protein
MKELQVLLIAQDARSDTAAQVNFFLPFVMVTIICTDGEKNVHSQSADVDKAEC